MAQRVGQYLTEAQKARNFAKAYVALVEALMREGVTEETARNEARIASMVRLNEQCTPVYDPAVGPCPTCKRG